MKSGTGCSYENNDALTSQHFDNDETTLSRTSAWKIQTIENMSRCNSVQSKHCQRYSGPESWVLNWPVKLTWSFKSFNQVASFVYYMHQVSPFQKLISPIIKINDCLYHETLNNAMTPVFHRFLPRKTFRKNQNIHILTFPMDRKENVSLQ